MANHAYLIIAHHNFNLLQILLSLLDDKRNDIYVHIDKKAKQADMAALKKSVKVSNLLFVDRMNVIWGDYSQIECELSLLKAALQHGNYEYLHLLSGVDLPIKTQDYIHNFFSENRGREFIEIVDIEKEKIEERCKYYRPQFILGNHKNNHLIQLLGSGVIKIQRLLGVNRLKKDTILKKGSNWFSITADFANYLVSQYAQIKSAFRYTICCDEVFLQTLFYNSEFWKNRYQTEQDGCQNMRLVDWKRGNPYIFRSCNFNEIKESPYLFARKFDYEVDCTVVHQVARMVAEN